MQLIVVRSSIAGYADWFSTVFYTAPVSQERNDADGFNGIQKIVLKREEGEGRGDTLDKQ